VNSDARHFLAGGLQHYSSRIIVLLGDIDHCSCRVITLSALEDIGDDWTAA